VVSETYKWGGRAVALPITLQAVWTADNGQLPPWKGDYHHDLNTQLSYWPCYSGNRLEDGLAFLDGWAIKPRYRPTRSVFRGRRLNVPGVATLDAPDGRLVNITRADGLGRLASTSGSTRFSGTGPSRGKGHPYLELWPCSSTTSLSAG
jgi:hypothetical protein